MGRMSLEQRVKAVVLKEQGQSYSQIAKQLAVSRLSIIKVVRKHRDTRSVVDKHGRGRKRSTTIRDD